MATVISGVRSTILLLSWWIFSALFAAWNKTLLRSYNETNSSYIVLLLTTHIQLLACSIMQSLTLGFTSSGKLDQRINGNHVLVACLTIIMTSLSNLITQQQSIAYNQVIKSSEPVIVLLFRWMLYNTKPTRNNLIGSLTIVFGMTIFVTGKSNGINLSSIALGGAMVISSAYRSTILKRLFDTDDSFSVTCLIHNAASVATSIPNLIFIDQSVFSYDAYLVVGVGFTFWAYNTLSYYVLKQISVENHAVGKFGKNVFIFAVSIVILGEARTANELVGIVVCCLGIAVFISTKK